MFENPLERAKYERYIEYNGRSTLSMFIGNVGSFFSKTWDLLANGAKVVSNVATSFVSFSLAVYATIPPALEKVCNWFDSFLRLIDTMYSSHAVQSVLTEFNSSLDQMVSQNASTQSLWDWVKYALNSDILVASVQAFSSMCFLWVELTVVLFLVICSLLIASFTAYGLRKAVALFTLGFVKG